MVLLYGFILYKQGAAPLKRTREPNPRLGTWFILTSRVEGTEFFIFQTLSHVSAWQSILAHRCT